MMGDLERPEPMFILEMLGGSDAGDNSYPHSDSSNSLTCLSFVEDKDWVNYSVGLISVLIINIMIIYFTIIELIILISDLL